jgi:glycosyltransferase involved in cell wall biosynthesis
MFFEATRLALIILLGVLAFVWLVLAAQTSRGMRRLPHLSDVWSLSDAALPSVSLIFSARDEAEKMSPALRSMLAQDYPAYEVIAADDRSTDRTQEILREFCATCKHLRILRVDTLPPGWLGKPHGLQTAYETSTGDWLVFTDADVIFHPEALRRAVSLALERNWDHLTLFPRTEMAGFGEKMLLTYFLLGGLIYGRAWSLPERESRAYIGVGAFQLLRRNVYEAIGTHRRLALEVVDDMKLGKLVKDAGFVSGVALADDFVRLRWYAGVANIIRGTEKNFFAAAGFRLEIAAVLMALILLLSVVPFVVLAMAGGWTRILAAVAVACVVVLHSAAARVAGVSPLYGLTHPLGALLFCFMLARSTVLTLWNHGIYWRGTFYSLDELRRGAV